MDIVTAARLAGHASVQTTIVHYLKTDVHRMQQAVEGISLHGEPPAGGRGPKAAGGAVQRSTSPPPAPSAGARSEYFQHRRRTAPRNGGSS